MTTVDDRQAQVKAARESFSGKTLTDSQFQEAWAISSILNSEIHRAGSFREKLTDYAHAYARSEKFDAPRDETILRDIYQGRYGQTMNQTREGLLEAQETLPDIAKTRALECAESIGQIIQDGPTQPFYQAYDRAAVALSGELGVTQSFAKDLMKETFQTYHDKDLYAHGKALEEAHHKPMREAESAARKAQKLQMRRSSHSRA